MKDGDATGSCVICGKNTIAHNVGCNVGLPGYAIVPSKDDQQGYYVGHDVHKGDKICYECCGRLDSEWMRIHDRIMLYLSYKEEDGRKKWDVSNWPGTLTFPASVSVSKRGHYSPFAGYMELRHAYFRDEHGRFWSGRSIGDWTEICHCRKLKKGGRAEANAKWWLQNLRS